MNLQLSLGCTLATRPDAKSNPWVIIRRLDTKSLEYSNGDEWRPLVDVDTDDNDDIGAPTARGETIPGTGSGEIDFVNVGGDPFLNSLLADALNARPTTSQLGAANGIAQLGVDGKVRADQMPTVTGGMSPQGAWNANTNSPTIPAASSGNRGHFYLVSVAGSTNIDGITSWAVGDMLVNLNGSTWSKIDNQQAVTSVAGKVGAVTLTSADVGLGNASNTSDATKWAATATLTNKTIDGSSNTLQNIAQSSITGLSSALLGKLGLVVGTPTGGVDGEVRMGMASPDLGTIWERAGGVWSRKAGNAGPFSDMLAVASPVAGMEWFVTTIALGGDVGTVTINTRCRYDGSKWRALHPFKLFSIEADSSSVTNSTTSFQSMISMTPPVDLFLAGYRLEGAMRPKTTTNGTPTFQPQINANGALLCSSNFNVDQFANVRPRMWCRSHNVLSANGGAAGMDNQLSTTASVTMGAAFNGSSVTFQIGGTFSATGSDVVVVYEDVAFWIFP